MPDIGRDVIREVQDVVERARGLQRDLADGMVAPMNAVLDLLEESGSMFSKQAEALSAAAKALEETSEVMKAQAALFERSIDALRQPVELARAAAALERPRKRTKS